MDRRRRQINVKAPKFLPCTPKILSEMNCPLTIGLSSDRKMAVIVEQKNKLLDSDAFLLGNNKSAPAKPTITVSTASFGITAGSKLCQGVTNPAVKKTPKISNGAISLVFILVTSEKYHFDGEYSKRFKRLKAYFGHSHFN